jgi:hypothetical protein
MFFKGFGPILLSRDNVAKLGLATAWSDTVCLLLPSEPVGYHGGKWAYYTHLADVRLTDFNIKFVNLRQLDWCVEKK